MPGMPEEVQGRLHSGAKIAVVVSRFNEFITGHLLAGAVDAWRQLGGDEDQLTVVHVPGALELAVTAKKLAESGRHEAVLCLGCVIRGETDHYDHVVEQTAKGIREVGTQTGVPCVFGVLTCDTLEQAIHRAGAKMGNAGRSGLMTAVEMADLMGRLGDEAAAG
jgi:6,7-dimethyl-8-ribityllumazine synthase